MFRWFKWKSLPRIPAFEFPLLDGLNRLLAAATWPPIVSKETLQKFAPEESVICLEKPPFVTLARERELASGTTGSNDFWVKYGRLDQINPDLAVIIGDFGIGSETVVILDYSRNPSNPPVLRLRWGIDGNEWVHVARNFDEFAEMLGLGNRITK